MRVLNDSMALSTIDNGRAVLSSTFLGFCVKVRNNDPSILPEPGEPFLVRRMCEREDMELADALLENTNVTDLELWTTNFTKRTAEAMAKYVRTSKRLQHIRWKGAYGRSQQGDDMLCCFLLATQESTSPKELHIELLSRGRPSNQALEYMLTHTQSLRSLTLSFSDRCCYMYC
jgi:hypothetical protein